MRATLSDRIPGILSSQLPLNTYPAFAGSAEVCLPESGLN
jgi:hypothetical protein